MQAIKKKVKKTVLKTQNKNTKFFSFVFLYSKKNTKIQRKNRIFKHCTLLIFWFQKTKSEE